MREVLPPDIAAGLARCFEQAMSSDDTATLEVRSTVRARAASQANSRHYEARVVRCDDDKVLSIVRDITEPRRAELQARTLRNELAHVGRVTTLAALTGSLAHEINQPLAAVMTNAQAARRLMAAPVPDLAELRAALADIVADNQRAAEVVKRLRRLLRKDTSEYVLVDINDSIGEVIKVLRGDIVTRRIALDVELAPELPLVLGDRVQLQQVTLNLLMNAFEALESDDRSVKPVLIRTALVEGMVTVEVEDDGVGLTDEELPRMFEPFYTTKPEGMGLGLAICQTILNAHDGSVGVVRNAGRGTTFSFQDLPGRRLRNLVDDLDVAQLLVRRDALGDVRHDLVRRVTSPCATTNAFGTSPASSSATGTTAASAMAGCASEHRLELRGCDLHTLVLDQLLHAVDDEEAVVLVGVADVAGVQPPVRVDRRRGRLGPVQVALHDLGTANRRSLPPRSGPRSAPDSTSTTLHLGVGDGRTDAAGLAAVASDPRRVRDR